MISIYLDMDGTIADLYNYDNWLEYLENESPLPFRECAPIGDIEKINSLLEAAQSKNILVGVITWTPKDASKKYCKAVEKAKRNWLKKYLPAIKQENIFCLEYGTPKAKANFKRTKEIYLVDDNMQVLAEWQTKSQRKAVSNTKIFDLLEGVAV